jgi:hypothetical protein
MTLHTSIADSLINAFPSASHGLPALLQLSEIVESTAVPTAAVECTRRPRLLINPEFVAKHANTPGKLAMLVMHELHHVILGHTRLHPRLTPLDNLVFDAVINSMLCRMLPERATRSMFTDFYRDDRFPECFLRPSPDWSPVADGSPPAALAALDKAPLRDLHMRLYSEQGVGYDELRSALADAAVDVPDVVLLGDHRPHGSGSSSDGDLELRCPEMLEQIRRIVERWPQPPTPIIGRSMADFVKGTRIEVKPPSKRSRLRWLLQRIAGRRGTATGFHAQESFRAIETPVPVLDRRAAVLHGLGHRPAFYRHALPNPRGGRGGERVHLYVDVSGSMNSVLGPLYGAAVDCSALVHPVVHLFSTKIAEVELRELGRGVVKSTGGTSIECVAAHMHQHGVRRAVVVTDGFVGKPGTTALATLRQCRLGVALIGPRTLRSDLDAVTDLWLDLNGGDE